MITLREYAIFIGRLALVGGTSEAKLVCLHNIELRAGSLGRFARTTVLEWVIDVVKAWHEHSIKCCEAAASYTTEVDVVLEIATKHLGSEVLAWVCRVALGQVQPVVEIEGD